MKKLTIALIVACSLVILSLGNGCRTTELNAAFIKIDTVLLQTNVQQGSAHHAINTVWLYANDTPIGVFELPMVVPLLELGSTNIKILAGVKQNGVLAQRIVYPFYTTYSQTIDFQAGQTYTITPTIGYVANAEFMFVNDFELGNNIADIDDNGNAEFVVTDNPDEVFEGQRSGKVSLSPSQTSFAVSTTNFYPNPTPSYPVFLEMSYRCDIPFKVLLRGLNDDGGSVISPFIRYVSEQKTWNKIYLDFTNDLADLDAQGYNFHQFIIEASLPEDTTAANFYFDNIKSLQQ